VWKPDASWRAGHSHGGGNRWGGIDFGADGAVVDRARQLLRLGMISEVRPCPVT
jgi:hypothetical protein